MASETDPIVAALERIAAALDRLAPLAVAEADPRMCRTLRWDGQHLVAVNAAPTVPLDRFVAVDAQAAALSRNMAALGAGRPAHDMLLWGARGMGKSALIRATAAAAGLSVVEASASAIPTLPRLFDRLAGVPAPVLVFVDDLAFAPGDPEIRALRSLLDGGVAARPPSTRLAVTSNHRHLVIRPSDEMSGREATARHARDHADDALALVDRFGLVLGFHAPSQEEYLAMCRGYLAAESLPLDETHALAFALARGGRSGRTAWHYRTDLLSRRATDTGPR
jgi:predicted AAA+ superfamily ATPase